MRRVIMVRTAPVTTPLARFRPLWRGGDGPPGQAEALPAHLDVGDAIAIVTALGEIDLAMALRSCQSPRGARRVARALLRLQRRIAREGAPFRRSAPLLGIFRHPLATIVAPMTGADADEIAHAAAWLARTGRSGWAITTHLDGPAVAPLVRPVPTGDGADAEDAEEPRRPARVDRPVASTESSGRATRAPTPLPHAVDGAAEARTPWAPEPLWAHAVPSIPAERANAAEPQQPVSAATVRVNAMPTGHGVDEARATAPPTAGPPADAAPAIVGGDSGDAGMEADQSVAAALLEMAPYVTPIAGLTRTGDGDDEDERLPAWSQGDDGDDAFALAAG